MLLKLLVLLARSLLLHALLHGRCSDDRAVLLPPPLPPARPAANE
jgi:hypothetical protein